MCKSCKQNEILRWQDGGAWGLTTPSEPCRLVIAVTAVPTAVLKGEQDKDNTLTYYFIL